ncbi:hypothetical protein BH09GEM1_BH09GEM1_01760 [soil metagenome]
MKLRIGTLFRFFVRQDLAFWAMCAYLVVEYVRPQQLIGPIVGWPLGQIVVGTAIFAFALSGAPGLGLHGAASWLLLLFTGVIVASSLTAYDPQTSFANIRVWFTWVAIYFMIINVIRTKPRFVFFLLVWLMCNYYMAQGGAKQFAFRGFAFADWGVTGAPGWFQNSGEFGIEMCIMFSISWHYYLATKGHLTGWRKLFVIGMPITAVLGVLGSSSRGAVLGLAAGVMLAFFRHRLNVRSIAIFALLVAVSWLILPDQQKERFSSAGEDHTSMTRKVYWMNGLDMARTHPLLGIGYENWLPYYNAFYRNSEASDRLDIHGVAVAHNIFIQCMAELGFIGLSVFLMLIIACPLIGAQTRRLIRDARHPPDQFMIHMTYAMDEALLSYLVSGFFVTVLYYPFFWINLAFVVSLNSIARRSTSAIRRAGMVRPAVRGAVASNPYHGLRPAHHSFSSESFLP